ncbi:ImmA/IrrE family metallo-endopeptidase [Mesorhizobium carmichaelinearum]|uniref:ImmA/IrrE family metallo-endopeptidase n=1 Tax=Mesorhizobium carmichaelinearum TaxID=1208188 RepID=UPI000BA3A6EE|nr:ImmA/IrrE family metallo-endopeptidase [Mesorhizobium carmichaelinearum]
MPEAEGFQPRWGSPPGATITDILSENAMSVETFADLLGEGVTFASELLRGEAVIDDEIASSLSETVGGSKAFWLRREEQYRKAQEQARSNATISSSAEWIARLPIADMKRFGWIPNTRSADVLFAECLKFFAVPNLAAWEASYRPVARAAAYRLSKSYVSDPMAIVTWLRFAEKNAERITSRKFDAVALQESLPALRKLTLVKDLRLFMPRVLEICASCGVAVVVVPTPRGCPASGATRVMGGGTAMIALSLRYKTDDQFWFTFFHEVAHLLLHSDRAFFLEDGSDVTQVEEDEANEFSAKLLIPDEYSQRLMTSNKGFRNVIRLAVSVGTSPGIVVGQMQHKGYLRFDQLNSLKRRYRWNELG